MLIAVDSDVFSDLPSGLRVESGDSLDLLSAVDSIDTSSEELGKGGTTSPDAATPPLMGLLDMSLEAEVP